MVYEEKEDKSYNPVMDAIYKRRSIRKYKERPVEWDKIGELVNAGRMAPSAGNLQNWRFVIVTDKDKISKLAAAANQNWVAYAPAIIVIVAEHLHGQRFYGVRGERLYNVQNCAAAAENMLLAAHALGLGACWIGSFSEDLVNSILGIPDYGRPQVMVTVGYPDEEVELPSKYRIELVTFMENWGSRIVHLMFYMNKPRVIEGGVRYSKGIFGWFQRKLFPKKVEKEKEKYEQDIDSHNKRIEEENRQFDEEKIDTEQGRSPPELM